MLSIAGRATCIRPVLGKPIRERRRGSAIQRERCDWRRGMVNGCGRGLRPSTTTFDAWRLSEVSVLAARVKEATGQDAALKRAMDAEIKTWPDRYDPPLLVPLVENGGEWVANALNQSDETLSLFYNPSMGLRFSPHARGLTLLTQDRAIRSLTVPRITGLTISTWPTKLT